MKKVEIAYFDTETSNQSECTRKLGLYPISKRQRLPEFLLYNYNLAAINPTAISRLKELRRYHHFTRLLLI